MHTFRHEMLPYADGTDGFVRGVYPMLARALAAGAPVLVAVRRDLIAALKEAVGEGARHVRFLDIQALGGNPARIIPVWERFVVQDVPLANGSGPALGIGEPVWPGRGAAELQECELHEHLLNTAFEGRAPWRLVCPYDIEGLGPEVIQAAQRTHAFVCTDGDVRRQRRLPRRRGGMAGALRQPAGAAAVGAREGTRLPR